MKKTILLFITMAVSAVLFSQQVPNGDFEKWEINNMFQMPKYPAGIKTISSNGEIFLRNDTLNVTKVAGHNGSAIRLQTVELMRKEGGKDSSGAYFVIGGQPDNGMIFPGGFPFTDSTVKSIAGFFRYSINVASPGAMVLQFKKAGADIGGAGIYIFPMSGSQATFKLDTFDIMPRLTDIPDSLVIGFVSNDMLNDGDAYPGNFLEIDSLHLIGTTQQIPEGKFDNWENIPSMELPADWTMDYIETGAVYKDTNKLDSSSAIKLIKIADGREDRISLGVSGWDEVSKKPINIPGFKVNGKPRSVYLSYKYTCTSGTDTAQFHITLTKYDNAVDTNRTVGSIHLQLTKTTGWITITDTIMYWGGMGSETPDSAIISIEAGRWDNKTASAVLLIDNIYLNSCADTIVISGSESVCTDKKTDIAYSVFNTYKSTYTWTLPAGVTVTGDNDTNKIVLNFGSAAGEIKVVKTYKDGCLPDSAKLTVKLVKCISGVELSSDGLSVYPNPASSVLYFSQDVETVSIADISGKLVLSKTVNGRSVSIDNLASGMYIVTVKTSEGIVTQKIIVE